jgi:hypothetical protein
MTLQSRPMRRPAPKPAKQCDYTPRPRTPALRRDDGKARMVVPVPKRPAVRNQALREAYRMLPCQFQWPGMLTICGAEDGTVACCHANWAAYGKGMARKADDTAGASGCIYCHRKLDQGKTYSAEEKRQAWESAHARSVALLTFMGLWPDASKTRETLKAAV